MKHYQHLFLFQAGKQVLLYFLYSSWQAIITPHGFAKCGAAFRKYLPFLISLLCCFCLALFHPSQFWGVFDLLKKQPLPLWHHKHLCGCYGYSLRYDYYSNAVSEGWRGSGSAGVQCTVVLVYHFKGAIVCKVPKLWSIVAFIDLNNRETKMCLHEGNKWGIK